MTKPKQTGLHWLDKGSDREGRPLCGRPFPLFARGISRVRLPGRCIVRSARPPIRPHLAAAFLPFVRKTMSFVKKVLK